MKKIILSCFALLLLHNLMYGQAKNDPRAHSKDPAIKGAFLKEQTEDVKNNAEFVFEGIYQKQDVYPRGIDNNGMQVHVGSAIIKITKVFRGNLKPGTIETIGKCQPGPYEIGESPNDRISNIISDSTKYIFFCRNANKDFPYDTKYNIYPVDNKTILTAANQYISCGYRVPERYMFETKINSKGDVYKYISKLPHVKMPVITKEDTVAVFCGKITPGEPQRMPQAYWDSLRAIQTAKNQLPQPCKRGDFIESKIQATQLKP